MSSESSVAKSKNSRKHGKKKLDCFDILNNSGYESIESICISIKQESTNVVDVFMENTYLKNNDLLIKINAIIATEKIKSNTHSRQKLTASLLLILPFINSSAKIEHKICEKYVLRQKEKKDDDDSSKNNHNNNNFCKGLVFALSQKLCIISLQCKTWILCTLCHIIERQHNLNISTKISDAYDGLIAYSLQTLQCPFSNLHSSDIIFKIKQYAIRILLCELNEGVMARQYLKDEFTNLIVLQSIIMLHEQYDDNNDYNDEYQWLMVKLLQYLYRSFDFNDLWITLDEYTNNIDSGNIAFNDNIKSYYLKSYLMIRAQFASLLKMKCKLFIQDTKGIFIRVAIKLLLEYPLNPSKLNINKYCGPNWQYEFERLLRNEDEWNDNIVDHLISLSANNMSNINIINTINIKDHQINHNK